jgi:transcriptional regulator with XRE-family HTH domain
MQDAGRKLRRTREYLSLKYRDVEEASLIIARQRGNAEFAIGLSRLADIENKGTVPSVYRIYSMAAIYGLSFRKVLHWYGVDLDALPGDSITVSLGPTRPLDFEPSPDATFDVPAEFDRAWDVSKTSFLSRQVQRWGKLPLALLGRLEGSYRYGLIGEHDWSMYPIIPPGSFVQIDESKRRVAGGGWTHEHERPIYFVEHRKGYRCGWCAQRDGFLVLQPYPASQVSPEIFRFPGEADVIGQIVGLAMRLDLAKGPHTRS